MVSKRREIRPDPDIFITAKANWLLIARLYDKDLNPFIRNNNGFDSQVNLWRQLLRKPKKKICVARSLFLIKIYGSANNVMRFVFDAPHHESVLLSSKHGCIGHA